LLEDFKLSFNVKKWTVKIESAGTIGVLSLYRKVREWEASAEGIVFPEILEGIDKITLPGGDQTAVVIVFINGWRLESDVEVNLVGGLVAGKDKEGKPCHPVEDGSRSNVRLLSQDRDFIPTEAQIQHAESAAASFAEDWEIDAVKREILRKSSATGRVHSIFGLYWFLKTSWLKTPGLSRYSFPLEGDNRPPVPGLERRWDLDNAWSVNGNDLSFLAGGPLVHRGRVIIPSLSEEERETALPEAEAASRRESTTIGIITALPEEFATVRAQLDDVIAHNGVRGQTYLLGTIPARGEGRHHVALTMTEMGNNQAAVKAAALLCEFPSVTEVVMVGIAGAVPNPEKVEDHVRLGDIIVSGPGGVVQYDYVKDKGEVREPRHSPRPPSPRFHQVVRLMRAGLLAGEAPWNEYLTRCSHVRGTERPAPDKDRLAKTDNPDEYYEHPDDPDRPSASEPRLFVGTIGAANVLLKNPVFRDEIRERFGVRAVEMESSGIADSSFELDASYFVVRGTCDYCDANKNDEWHGYAAAVASAFLAAMLRKTPALTPRPVF